MSQPKKVMPKKETTKKETTKKEMPKKELPKKSVAKEAGKKAPTAPKSKAAPKQVKAPKSKAAPKPQSQAPKHTITAELQYAGKAIPISEIIDRTKDACGNGDVNIYIKPEESRVYYVSGDVIGSFEI